jgi:hypothetical protein
LAECVTDFWSAGDGLSGLRIRPWVAELPGSILKQFGPAPVEIQGKKLAEMLAPAYEAMTTSAAMRAFDQPGRTSEIP